MARAPGHVLERLRRNRRTFGWVLAALMVASLADPLVRCQGMDAAASGAAAAAQAAAPATMPCAECGAGDAGRLLASGSDALPGGAEPWLVFALVVMSVLLALGMPKSIPIPRRPVLPTRPRTLEFCVLRI